MEVIFIILPITLGIAALFVGAFVWATRRGQYDDTATPPVRILFRDDDDA